MPNIPQTINKLLLAQIISLRYLSLICTMEQINEKNHYNYSIKVQSPNKPFLRKLLILDD